jgi:hypothetical protein
MVLKITNCFSRDCRSCLHCKSIETHDALVDDCVVIQFLDSLHPSIRDFVLATKPKSAAEAAEATDYQSEIQGHLHKDGHLLFMRRPTTDIGKISQQGRKRTVPISTATRATVATST